VTTHLLPPPYAIGAPEVFDSWRPHQPRAILKAIETDKRFVAMVLPTGAGKSLTVVGAALLAGWRTVILTSTKGLQTQYTNDFSPTGMIDVRGKNAYQCVAFNDEFLAYKDASRWQSCEEGPCSAGMRCSRRPTTLDPDAHGCQYYDAIRAAREARLVVTNYKFWLAQNTFSQGLGRFDCLVLDEAHNAPQELADFLSTVLHHKDIEGALQVSPPNDVESLSAWKSWAKTEGGKAERALESWKPRTKQEMIRFRQLKTAVRKLTVLASIDPEDWVVTESPEGYHFDPIWVRNHAEGSLFLEVPKVILTSATFNKKTAEMMGVDASRLEWHETPSDFPIARRPVYYVPTVKVDFRTDPSQERLWVARIDQIIRSRGDRKGMIHTVSYKRRNLILQLSEYRDRMISHDTHTARAAVQRFKDADPGAILVSPSMTTGYDFPYDECEYQIILKIPFPDSRTPVVQARTKVDKDYPAYIAMQELVQAVGRGMRAVDDQCETFIIDDNCKWFLGKYRMLAPTWFLQAYRRVETLPVPPKPLRRIA
jgi:ATP-dependent DNA helicase DinG